MLANTNGTCNFWQLYKESDACADIYCTMQRHKFYMSADMFHSMHKQYILSMHNHQRLYIDTYDIWVLGEDENAESRPGEKTSVHLTTASQQSNHKSWGAKHKIVTGI